MSSASGARVSPFVSFVVPVRDDAARLARCLASIRRCEYASDRVEIIVADNGSRDASADVARRAGATVLSLPGLRVAQLRNGAAAAARGDILAFVDADHEIHRAWVADAADSFADPRVGAVGALCHAPEGGTWVQSMYDALRARSSERREVEWLGSGNLAVRRAAFDELGGFAEDLDTCEDVELCQRLRGRGWRLLNEPGLASVHHGDPATLAQLFRGELWRGRDNLRASLRGRLTLRAVPGIAIPLLDLACLAALVGGVTTAPKGGLLVAAPAAGVLAMFAALRAARMLARRPPPRPADVVRALIVAGVYDVARSLALVARTPHWRRAGLLDRVSVR